MLAYFLKFCLSLGLFPISHCFSKIHLVLDHAAVSRTLPIFLYIVFFIKIQLGSSLDNQYNSDLFSIYVYMFICLCICCSPCFRYAFCFGSAHLYFNVG